MKYVYVFITIVLSIDLSAQVNMEEITHREAAELAHDLYVSAESWGIEPIVDVESSMNETCPEGGYYISSFDICRFTLVTYLQKYDATGGVSHGQPYCELRTITWNFPSEACKNK